MSIAGKWKVSMDTPIGKQQLVWDLQAQDGGWRGTMESRAGVTALEGIQVEADRVSFSSRINGPMGVIDLSFEGTRDGDKISGTCRTLFGNSEFAGERV